MVNDTPSHDLAGERPPMAGASSGAQAPDSLGSDRAGCGREHGLREGTRLGGEDSRSTRPDRATRYVETVYGVLSYSELAPLLSDRVIALEADLLKGALAEVPIGEPLVLDIHQRIAGDLVLHWAGRWRDIEVTVGAIKPPPPFRVPILMRDYMLDLKSRWSGAMEDKGELLLELLAFAEGRFLTIHPFRDFNGRTIRVFLIELLRRLDLPRVQLAPQTDSGREEYFAALEAADHHDWRPLTVIWQRRLTETSIH